MERLSALAYSFRPGTTATQLEWLKTPSSRPGPSTIAETLEKVRYLKALGAHTWNLSGVALTKQQAYARQVQSRRPAKTREIKPTRQWIELVCFLRVTLLELTDVALLQSSRRSQQLFGFPPALVLRPRFGCASNQRPRQAISRPVP